MTHLVLPLVAAFLVPPIPPLEGEREDASGLPLVFAVFCLAAVAMTLLEALWPPLATALNTTFDVVMPQL